MASQEITVNTNTLAGDIDTLRATLQVARKQLEDMFSRVAELDTMWDGPSNEAFNTQFRIDYENSKNLCDTVEAIIECMEFAKNQYNTCENEVNSIVSSISI